MALIVITDPDAPVETCVNNHPQTAENLRFFPDRKRNGVLRRYCQPCRSEAAARARAKRASLDAQINPAEMQRTIWERLPTDFRNRLVLAMQAPPPGTTYLQIEVLRKAAQHQCWYRAGSEMAVRLFFEAILAETVDATSPSLRVDRLFALVFYP